LGELRHIDIVGGGEDSAAGAGLDHVGAVLDVEADGTACFVGVVDDAFFGSGLLAEKTVAETALVVAVTACGPDCVRGDKHARTGDDAAVDAVAKADVDEVAGADITHGGEACHQGFARVRGGADGEFSDRHLEAFQGLAVIVRVELHAEVSVGVDETGREGGVA
jgi:hypothetical protein